MGNTDGKINAVFFDDQFNVKRDNTGANFVNVDNWQPSCNEEVFVSCIPGYFVAPISIFNNVTVNPDAKFDYFILSTKKCYNSVAMRQHLAQYINYFLNYYDTSKEYLSILFAIKIRLERYTTEQYNITQFFSDLDRYIVKSNIANMVEQMVEDNYCQNLDYTNTKSPSLQYTNEDAKLLQKMSIIMDLCIPLLTTYAYMHKVGSIDDYLLSFYDVIIHMDPSVDMYVKLFNTAYTNVVGNQKNNMGIWIKQDIRSIDVTTHSTDSVYNIILNIMPKYTFDKKIISFNYSSIHRNTGYKITDIAFEFNYIPLSSSKRDNDSISDCDKYEADLITSNERLYVHNEWNGDVVMKTIDAMFGPFDQAEIDFYTKSILIDNNGNFVMNSFQKQLLSTMFYRYFRDTISINSMNREDYVKLILAAKKILKNKNMIILPYIISGKVKKLVSRKTVNKKEKALVEASPTYPKLLEKYRNNNVSNYILSIIATILSSEFTIVDMNPEINGVLIDTVAINIIIEEVEMYILMC